jgi:prevent-host-death family protein
MRQVVSIDTAKSNLSQLVKRAAAGETVYIGAYGRAEVKLVPVEPSERAPRRFGLLAGKLRLPEDLDAPLLEVVIRSFDGGE